MGPVPFGAKGLSHTSVADEIRKKAIGPGPAKSPSRGACRRSDKFYQYSATSLNGSAANISLMLRQITPRTTALAVQLAGITLLAAVVSVIALRDYSAVWQLGAFTFVVGCYLEARCQPRSSNIADRPFPEFLGER